MYKEYIKERQDKYSNFAEGKVHYAFGKSQLDRLLNKLRLSEDELKEKYVGLICGGIILKEQYEDYKQFLNNQELELRDKLFNDEEFAYSAFRYEMANHELFYTGSHEQAIGYLGLDIDEVISTPLLFRAFKKAKEVGQREFEECN